MNQQPNSARVLNATTIRDRVELRLARLGNIAHSSRSTLKAKQRASHAAGELKKLLDWIDDWGTIE